nr:hypothetical protein [Tanacetum cinerariifolium]
MHKAFPVLVRKFPLPEGTSHCLKKNATARRKVLPLPEVCTAIIVKEKSFVKSRKRSESLIHNINRNICLRFCNPYPFHEFIIMSNINNNMQTQTSNTVHNAIMEAGSKDRPPMLAPGNYVKWKSRIKRYIDTKPNHDLIHYCLENPPYQLDWTNIEVPVSEGSPITTTERIHDTYKNVSQDIRDQLNAEAEAGESFNVQDLETNLYWEFGKFTSQDGETLESYYSRFYKMMNELIRNLCKVTNHQVNVQFLLHLQPEWQRSQQVATMNRGKAIVNTPQPIYDQEPSMVDEDDETNTGYERIGNVAGAKETVAGSKDRLPMLAPGNYVQWKSKIKRYIDTKPNHELIHYCLKNPPDKLDWKDIQVPVSEGSPITTTARIHETYKNVSQEIRDQLNAEAEAVQIILTGIDNDIYSTVDACPNACEMWKAIERLK